MNKLLFTVVAVCTIGLTGCGEEDSNPTGSSSPLHVGTWKGSVNFGITRFDAAYIINADSSYKMNITMGSETDIMSEETGVWAVSNSKIIFTPSVCREMNDDMTALETVDCDGADTVALPTSTNWTITDEDDNEFVLKKQ